MTKNESKPADVKRLTIADRFEIIVAAGDVQRSKPDPGSYLAAHAAFNRKRPIAARACVVIEDSLRGLEAAHAAGMRCAMLATSHAPNDLAAADVVWDSFAGHDPAELLPLSDG